ncbi:MAG TPA: hypothetical protein VMZ91_11455 [Candidatus Paceibacterota bacterium]|nr:hypothetical protein [Candidatus Paceibacterota bacterium]
MTNKDISKANESNAIERINLDELELKPKRNPWKYARQLEKDKIAEFIEPEDIYKLVSKFDNPRDKALFCFLYLTACRIEEAVRYKQIKWGRKKVLLIRQGYKPKQAIRQDYKNRKEVGGVGFSIRKEDIKVKTQEGRECVIIRIRNLKNKQIHENIKIIPIPLDNEINKTFYSHIKILMETKEDWEELFPFGKRNAEKIINTIKWNPHFIRKVRLTHLVRIYNLNEQELRIYAGWTDTRPSKHYVKLSWKNLIKKL